MQLAHANKLQNLFHQDAKHTSRSSGRITPCKLKVCPISTDWF